MNIFQDEINLIIENLKSSFIEPFNDNSLEDFITKGSKFIRSKLAILYLKSQGYEINEKFYKIFSAVELIHCASLLHDDVIDDADYRRGVLTIAKRFNPKMSILAGDYLLAYAIEKLLVLNNFYIIDLFKSCTKKMALAEIKQYQLRGKHPSLEDYIEICEGKTATLFSSLLISCAYLSSMDVDKAKIFGNIFGLSFQIKNDMNKDSAIIDKKNGILTAIDILGIEKTQNLLDNYRVEMNKLINDFPENIYKESLKDLINSL